jgi:radical SAM superfamily enzyme YgiQ (UPF0313 family)
MPHLLLINPSNEHKGLGNLRSTAWPPLNLPYLAALTPDHYEIEIIDEHVTPFVYTHADIVGITAYTSTVSRAYEIAAVYRKKGIPTVMGGIHVSMMPEEAMGYCDAVVVGEAETVWPRVLEDFENGTLQKQYQGTWADLENLPMPRRDVLNPEHYGWGSIQTSRGCPMNCSFCSVTAFNGRRFRRRNLDQVLAELEQIPQKRVMLTDDNIIGYSRQDQDWAKAFFSGIIRRGIKKHFFAQGSIQFGEDPELVSLASRAGLKILLIGIESVNPESLKSYQKSINLKRLMHDKYHDSISSIRNGGITILGAFLLGSDEDDRSIFQTTLDFAKSSHIDVLQITKPTPLPGTRFWDELSKEGRIIKTDFPKDWEDYRLTKMVFEPAKMTIEDVYEGFTYVKIMYYGFWETVKRTWSTLWTTKDVMATLIAYKINASYRKGFIISDHYKLYNRPGLKQKFTQTRSR